MVTVQARAKAAAWLGSFGSVSLPIVGLERPWTMIPIALLLAAFVFAIAATYAAFQQDVE